jgi:hypothetical protein
MCKKKENNRYDDIKLQQLYLIVHENHDNKEKEEEK